MELLFNNIDEFISYFRTLKTSYNNHWNDLFDKILNREDTTLIITVSSSGFNLMHVNKSNLESIYNIALKEYNYDNGVILFYYSQEKIIHFNSYYFIDNIPTFVPIDEEYAKLREVTVCSRTGIKKFDL